MIFATRPNLINRGRNRLRSRDSVDIDIKEFNGGVNVLFSETRLKPNEAKEATNLILGEDGVWSKRWGSKAYGGVTFTNTPDGFSEYKKTDGTRELIVVADGYAYVVDPSAETKTQISGATFTQGTRCDFIQINDFLYIVNGVDAMARYNGTALSTYSSISTPAWAGTPLTRGAGLSAGSYTYYYRVSAVNEVGETLAVAAQSITVDIKRGAWDEADEYIDLDWNSVSGALKYNIYMSDVSGYETKLDETTSTDYRDDGTAELNPYIEPPLESTAAGPKFASIAVIGNRIWGTKDPNNPQRIYWSGTGTNLGNFAPSFDGGYVDLEIGSRTSTVKVVDFNRECHVICETDDGRGAIWEIDLGSITIAGVDVIIPVPSKIINQMGSAATRGIVQAENYLYFINPFGVFTLGYRANILNALQTKEQSVTLRPYIRGLYEADLDKSCAYYYDSKVFFSAPTSSGEPNRIFYYDLELNAWVKDWTIGVSQFGEFTDSGGTTHFLGISGNKLIEFSENYPDDDGTAFVWKFVSPRYQVSKDFTRYAFIERAYINLRNAKGAINVSISGTDFAGQTPTTASSQVEILSSDTGMGWDIMGEFKMGDSSGTPTTFAKESLTRYLPIDSIVRDIQWEISGSDSASSAVITRLKAKGNLIETDEPEDHLLS